MRLLPSAERAALLQCLWRLRRLRCADTKSTFIVLALKLPLKRNICIYSLPQPAGPVKVAKWSVREARQLDFCSRALQIALQFWIWHDN